MKKRLKFVGLIMCFFTTLLMVSCSSDEIDSAKIVGTWGCVSSYGHIWVPNTEIDEEHIDEDRGKIIVFKEDGTYISSSRDLSIFHNAGTYMIDGNCLLINHNGDNYNIIIQELSNTTLKVHYSNLEDNWKCERRMELKRQ